MSEYLWETDDIEKQVKELETIDEYLSRGDGSQNFVDIHLPSNDGPAAATFTYPAATEDALSHTLRMRRLLAAAFALVLFLSVAFAISFHYNGGGDATTSIGEIDEVVPVLLSQQKDSIPLGGSGSPPEEVLSSKPTFPLRERSTPPQPQDMQEESSRVDILFGVKQVHQTNDYEPELNALFVSNSFEIKQDSTSTDTSSEDEDS